MNTANLQLEGLYLSIAAINEAIVRPGLLTREQVDAALRSAEETAASDYGNEDKSSANRDAVAFPMRVLRLANNMSADGQVPPFSELAKMVGQTKEPFNDQR
jgi:hypothetical protein